MESDLYPISTNDHFFEFADDTNMLVPEQSDVTMQEEFADVLDLALLNKNGC